DGSVTFRSGSCSGTILSGPTAVSLSGQASFSTSTLAAGSTTVVACYSDSPSIAFADSNGSVPQTVNARPTASLAGSTTICYGNSSTLTITVNGSGTISGTLSPGAIAFSGTAPTITKIVSPGVTTSYSLATLSDANCVAQAT